MALVVAVATCTGDVVRVTQTPVEITQTTRLFAVDGGLPTHGPRSELTVGLPDGYYSDRIPDGGYGVYGPNNRLMHLSAWLVLADGQRRALRFHGVESNGHFSALFYDPAPGTPGSVARGVELSADTSVSVTHLDWWSGDPASRCFLCL
jgi:hypothetical protein